jgi:hypothetical protein
LATPYENNDNKVPMFAGVPAIGRLVLTRLQFTL